MGLIDDVTGLFGSHNPKNPYEDAKGTYENYGNYLSNYLPYSANDFKAASGQYGNLVNDPTDEINKILKNYHMSNYAKHLTDQAKQGANAAAAAGGYIGTPQEQEAVGQSVGNIASQDQEQYLHDALGQYNRGLSGMSQYGQMGPQLASAYWGNMTGLTAGADQFSNKQAANRTAGIGHFLGDAAQAFGGPSWL